MQTSGSNMSPTNPSSSKRDVLPAMTQEEASSTVVRPNEVVEYSIEGDVRTPPPPRRTLERPEFVHCTVGELEAESAVIGEQLRCEKLVGSRNVRKSSADRQALVAAVAQATP